MKHIEPAGETARERLVRRILEAVAQYEKELSRDRTKSEIQAAARKGMKLGASKKLSSEQIEALERDLANPEMTVREAAQRAGIHINSVYNYVGGGKRTAMMKRT
jgi:DNA invertase Pin-like site-specific DNA recombinase